MEEGTPDAAETPDERRKRLSRESQARYAARKRGKDIPLRKTGPVRRLDPSQPKVCNDCGQEKPAVEYYRVRDSNQSPRLHSYCKDCCRLRGKAYREENPQKNVDRCRERYWADPEATRRAARQYRRNNVERARQYDRKRWPRRKAAKFLREYGLTVERYEVLERLQGGVCAICGQTDSQGHALVVDHCHDTGVVRGLLCHKCNVGIGLLRDDASVIRAALRYLEEPPARGMT